MKIFTCPNEVPAPDVDWTNFNHGKMQADEQRHQEALKKHLIGIGYDGEHTGRLISFPVADGSAQYMFADSGRKSALIHLPYGDAYHYRDAEFLPRAEILKRMDQQKRFNDLFSAQKPAAGARP